MKVAKFLLIALVASACIVQAQAGLGKLLDKVKDKVTGDNDKKDESKPEVKQDDSTTGMAKRVAHKVVEAASNQLESEAKNRIGSPFAKPAIAFVADKIEDKVHDAIDRIGTSTEATPPKSPEEPPKPAEEPPKPAEEPSKLAEGEPEKKGVFGGLMDKLTRRKRSTTEDGAIKKKGIISRAISKVKNLISGKKPVGPAQNQETLASPAPVVETKAAEVKRSGGDEQRVEFEEKPKAGDDDDRDDEHYNRKEETEYKVEPRRAQEDNEVESGDHENLGAKAAARHHDNNNDNDNDHRDNVNDEDYEDEADDEAEDDDDDEVDEQDKDKSRGKSAERDNEHEENDEKRETSIRSRSSKSDD